MRTYNQSVLPLIEMAYSKLTPLEKRVADYFMNQVNDEIYLQKLFLKDCMFLKHHYHVLRKKWDSKVIVNLSTLIKILNRL